MDVNLIALCAQGNRKAQYELYASYAKAMFNICLRMLGNTEDAEDVLQEAFLNAYRNASSFKGEATIGAWLKRIVINQCLNFLRGKKQRWEQLEAQWKKGDEPLEEPAWQGSDELDLSIARIRQAIQQLPDGFRVVLSLYLLEGYDHQEISEILGISESTSKSQYSRAKAKLRELLQ